MALFKNPKYHFLVFLVSFFVINLIQSACTGLVEDEAYYWVWSKNLAWGYFDHPPMVAVFIWLGGLLFEGELGVRFLSVISFSLMLYVMWDTLDPKVRKGRADLFFLLIVSLALLQIYGFVSTPDTPLMLFTATFFWVYKRFLHDGSTKNALLLGLAMAAMLYSKYHGILIVGFVVLSNLALLGNARFWMAGLFGLLLFTPHLLWQYENGFPSFVYHLSERASKPYSIGFTLNHLLNVLVVVGITFPVVYGALWGKRAEGLLERAYQFVIYGFIGFFFLTSFRSQPQAQWLAATLIPLALFVFPFFTENQGSRKWLYRLGLTQLSILILARFFLAVPSLSPVVLETHLADTWVPDLKTQTAGLPIVFVNSYQNASIYSFYTGIQTHSFGVPKGRKSQYALLDTEAEMQGKKVYAVGKQLDDKEYLLTKADDSLFGYVIDPFRSFQNIKCLIEAEALDMVAGQEVRIPFDMINTYDRDISIQNVQFYGVYQGIRKIVLAEVPLDFEGLRILRAGERRGLEAEFIVPKIVDTLGSKEITFRVGASFEGLPPGIQGNRVLVNYNSDRNQD